MTREEAIAYFKRHIELYCVEGISREAEEMAIKSLEQEPCCNCIEFKRYAKEMGFEMEQEPKIGHWTYICNSEINGLKIVECSECGKRTYGSGKYCPNCGAKMVEP